jgi:hypothetical protein
MAMGVGRQLSQLQQLSVQQRRSTQPLGLFKLETTGEQCGSGFDGTEGQTISGTLVLKTAWSGEDSLPFLLLNTRIRKR